MTAPVRTGRGRHAAGRRAPARYPGPVTAAFTLARRPHPKPLAVVLRAWPALFALALARPALAGSPLLGDYASMVLGLDATLCLIATILVTPLITVTKVSAAKLRWWYGVWMFVLGFAGLVLALTVTAGTMGERTAGNAVNWTGTLLVVLLFPAAAMSNKACQKLMGPEWKRWQRGLVWTVWAVVAGHLLLLHSWTAAVGLLMATAPLVALRNTWVRKGVKAWRADAYSGGWWWFGMAVSGVVFAAGAVILLTLEVQACAAALSLGQVPLG